MDILKRILALFLFSTTIAGCARSFEPELGRAPIAPSESSFSRDQFSGVMTLEDGTEVNLQDFLDKPLLLFFVSETCLSCREETEALIAQIQTKGQITNLRIISVMIGSLPEDIPFWKDSFSGALSWTVAADSDLQLYNRYFNVLRTPSVLFYHPDLEVLKKWQDRIHLEDLEKETLPWRN